MNDQYFWEYYPGSLQGVTKSTGGKYRYGEDDINSTRQFTKSKQSNLGDIAQHKLEWLNRFLLPQPITAMLTGIVLGFAASVILLM